MDLFRAFPYILTASLVGFLSIVIYCCKWKSTRNTKYPPGPSFALPLLGHLHLLGMKPHLAFQKWRKRYGAVFSCKLGGNDAVVISDAKLVRQVFSNPAANGRMRSAVMSEFCEGKYGLINQDDDSWVDRRRFTVRTLNTLGLSRGGVMEGIIADEAKRLVKFFQHRAGLKIPGNGIFQGAAVTSVWTMLTGERSEWDATEEPWYLQKMDQLVRAVNRTVETGVVFFPWLRLIAPKLSGWTGFVQCIKTVEGLADAILEKHGPARGNSNAFIEHYLAKIESTTDPTSQFYGDTGRKHLKGTFIDLIMAGSETVSTTMEYTMLYLSKYKHVQKEVQSELDREIGNQFPNLLDRSRLPYTEAFILETLRRSSVVGMGVPHRALADIQLDNYTIPMDTIILADFYNIHHNLEMWGSDSYDFRPERFLSEDKSSVVYRQDLMPFSTGRRMCIGESLANDSLFLFVTSLMQKFDVELTDDKFDVNDVIPGFALKPKPFQIVVKVRT